MRYKNIISFTFTTLVLIFLCFSCTREVRPTLNPDWVDVTLRVTGDGAPPADAVNKAQARLMAKEAAIADAYRELARQVAGVRVDSDTLVQDFITQSDRISMDVQAFIKKARVISTRENPDGSVEVVMELFLGKRFYDIVMR